MDNLFTNVGIKLKKFAKTYFTISMWLLIIGGVIAFFVCLTEEATVPFALAILFGVPLTILSNLLFCWMLHAFGSIAEKHENGGFETQPEVARTEDKVEPDKDEDKVARVALVVIVSVIIAFILFIVLGSSM